MADNRRPKHQSKFRDRSRGSGKPPVSSKLYLYGLHTVRQALLNPRRQVVKLLASKNGLDRLELTNQQFKSLTIQETDPKALDRLVSSDAVHQGVILEVLPLAPAQLEDVIDQTFLLVLDQVTDPHNVGAIMRSCVAMGATTLITTSRHSAPETGVLAKSASGALDVINHIEVSNLSKAIDALNDMGFKTIGLDSEGQETLEHTISGTHIALVLGAEGKGLRQKTRETCQHLARMDMPGEIKSLNVSNAAALSLYVTHKHLSQLK